MPSAPKYQRFLKFQNCTLFCNIWIEEGSGLADKVENETLTTKQAAQLLLLGEERIRQLSKEGWVEKTGRSRYPLVPLVQGYIRYLRDAERRTTKSASASRGQDLRNERAAFELSLLKREHLPREDLTSAIDVICGALNSEIHGLAARITRDPELMARIEEEHVNALNRIAKKIERVVGAIDEGRDLTGDPGTNSA